MSKDYEALHKLLQDGYEALGRISDYASMTGVRPVRIFKLGGEMFVDDGLEWHRVGSHFMDECTRLNLEWIATRPTEQP